jgi:hypothetical protein
VRESGGVCVLGNHEWMALKLDEEEKTTGRALLRCWMSNNPVLAGLAHALDEGGPELVDWMKSLPMVEKIEGATLSHAGLHQLGKWPYLHSIVEAQPTLEIMEQIDSSVAFFGHTHKTNIFHGPSEDPREIWLPNAPLILEPGLRYAITVGSAGQPRDGGHRARWVLWTPESRSVKFCETLYHVKDAAKAIIEAGLPKHSALRLEGWD